MYKIYTITNGKVEEGAEISLLEIKSANNIKIPAIIIGEEGRGRSRGEIPLSVEKSPCECYTRIYSGSISQTKSGKPKIISSPVMDNSKVIVVLRTQIGFRGSNEHTGDLVDGKYRPFPGELLATGEIAEGAAGRAGHGCQYVILLPKEEVVRTAYHGRLYGKPSQHFTMWDGEKLISLTTEEREASDIF